LKDYLSNRKEEEIYLEKIKHYTELKKREEGKKLNTIQQPTMRYRPRTDLERIYYTVNSQSMGKISKDIVDNQLAKLNLNSLKRNQEEELNKLEALLEKYKDIDDEGIEELQKQKDFLLRQGYDENNSESLKQISFIINSYNNKNNNGNNIAIIKPKEDIKNKPKYLKKNGIDHETVKKLNGDFNFKTFFKAASEYSIKLETVKNKTNTHFKNKIFDKSFDINNINNLNKTNIGNSNNNNNKNNGFDLALEKMRANTSSYPKDKNQENEINCFPDFDPRDEPDKEKEDFNDDMQFGANLNDSDFYLNNYHVTDNFNNIKNNKENNKDNINNRKINMSKTNYKKFEKVNLINLTSKKKDNNNKREYNPTLTSDFFNPGKKREDNLIDHNKLLYLKRLSSTNTLIIDNKNNNFTEYNNDLKGYLTGYLKKKANFGEKINELIDEKASKNGESDNIFVKASLVDNLDAKKCKKYFIFIYYFIFF
jgi:hypothetical protein